MDFKIDYGNVPLNPRVSSPSGPLYASVDGRVSSLSNGEVVFFDLATEQLHVMTEQVLGAMDLCRPFRTLDEHNQALRQAIPALAQQADAVKRVLESLIARGLLISDDDYLKRLSAVDAAPPAEFSGLFIRACDRPAQVRRLLESLLDYERRHSPRRRYVLIDDSRQGDNAREHRRLLTEFAAEAGVPVQYVGAEAWTAVADLVARATGRVAQSDWLLRRMPERRVHGGGLAMNLIAVLAAGRRYALLDDDFLFPLRLHPEADGRVDLGATGQMPARFFGGVDAALAAGREYDRDPLQDHLDACGASVGALLGGHALFGLGRNELRGLAPSALPHLAPGNRVIATVNGHRGHSGSATTAWLFTLDGKSRDGLWAERDSYLRHIDSPSLWYGPARTRLQAQGNFTPFMVDGSGLLPYTNPAGRGEDQLFASLCRLLEPQSLSAHLPTAVGHLQEQERSRAASLKQAFSPGFNAYLADMALTSASEFHAADRGARLRGFAARLRDMSGASDATILGELREHLAYTRSSLVNRMQAVLHGATGAPVYWQADLRQLIEVHGKALVQGGVPRLGDWEPQLDAAGCAQRYRESMSLHAEALELWPEVWAIARDQRERLWKSLI